MDPTSAPLADYFWIAGIDSLSFGDAKPTSSSNTIDKSSNGLPTSPPIETTIEEGVEIELVDSILGSAPRPKARHSRNNSWQRLSRLSNDARNSIHSVELIDNSNSNRSSLTIRAGPQAPINWTKIGESLAEFDFDRALSKFAKERESFLEDLSFSAGTVLQSRPPMTNRAERIKHDESETNGRKSPFGKVGGSIRRKISFRDMNSMKRQTTISRASESRIYISLTKLGELPLERVQKRCRLSHQVSKTIYLHLGKNFYSGFSHIKSALLVILNGVSSNMLYFLLTYYFFKKIIIIRYVYQSFESNWLMLHSICADHQTIEQLQFCDTPTGAPQCRSRYASLKTKI
jgi:hypothetical protein